MALRRFNSTPGQSYEDDLELDNLSRIESNNNNPDSISQPNASSYDAREKRSISSEFDNPLGISLGNGEALGVDQTLGEHSNGQHSGLSDPIQAGEQLDSHTGLESLRSLKEAFPEDDDFKTPISSPPPKADLAQFTQSEQVLEPNVRTSTPQSSKATDLFSQLKSSQILRNASTRTAKASGPSSENRSSLPILDHNQSPVLPPFRKSAFASPRHSSPTRTPPPKGTITQSTPYPAKLTGSALSHREEESNEGDDSFQDSLESPTSELGVLEDFVPEIDSHVDSIHSVGNANRTSDSFLNEDTQFLVEKATKFKPHDITAQNAEDLPIGVKKEKSVIDALKQEIFQLKLNIVIMETQLNNSSDSGVAHLKSRLAESEAARIAMKNENDKLRATMASLEEERNDDSNDQVQALEEELLQYETALGDAHEEQEYLKDYYEKEISQKENDFQELQNANNELVYQMEVLEQKNDELFDQLATARKEKRLSTVVSSTKDSSVDYRQLEEMTKYADHIKEKLIMRLQNASLQSNSLDLLNNSSTPIQNQSLPEFFLKLLNQIDYTVNTHVEEFDNTKKESETINNSYHELLDIYNSLKEELDNCVTREEAVSAIEEVENLLREKEQELSDLRDEKSELWENIREINQGLIEIENERAELLKQNDALTQQNEEQSTELTQTRNSLLGEVEELISTYKRLTEELALKDQELQSSKLEFSNCESELAAKSADVDALQARLKTLMTSHSATDSEKRSSSSRDLHGSLPIEEEEKSVDTADSNYIVQDILKKLQNVYGKEAHKEELLGILDEILESVKQFDMIEEQLNEANVACADLTTLIDNKLDEIVQLNAKIEDFERSDASHKERISELEKSLEEKTSENAAISKEIETVKQQILGLEKLHDHEGPSDRPQQDDSEASHKDISHLEFELEQKELELSANSRLIEELEENIKSLEIDLEAEQDLRAELEEVHSKYTKANQEIDDLSNENLELEIRNSELLADLEKLHDDHSTLQQQLEHEGSAKIIRNLTAEVEKLQEQVKEYEKSTGDLQTRMKRLSLTKDDLIQDIDKKNGAFTDVSRRKGQLFRDMEQLSHNYNKETQKTSSLERQVQSLMQATSTQGLLNATNVGNVFKQETYHRMLELDQEVQTLRGKLGALEGELKSYNLKYTKRGTEFASILTEILLALRRSSNKEWQSKISELLDEVRRNSGTAVDDFKRLGGVIQEIIVQLGSLKGWNDAPRILRSESH